MGGRHFWFFFARGRALVCPHVHYLVEKYFSQLPEPFKKYAFLATDTIKAIYGLNKLRS